MKIVIFSNGYPTQKYLRNGQFAWDQANIISKNHKVILMYVDLRSVRRIRKFGFMHELSTIDRIGYSFPIGRIPSKLRDYIGLKVTKKLLVKLNEFYQYDIIHSHFLTNGYYLAMNKSFIKSPFIHTEHSSSVNQNNVTKYVLQKMHSTYSKVDELVSVSYSIKDKIKFTTHKDSVIIPNVINFSDFTTLSQGNKKVFTITSTARFEPGKGHYQLINTFSRFLKKYPNSKLVLIGDGSLKISIIKHLKKIKITDSVTITGIISRNEINKIYLETDCFVLLTKNETFGLAVVEALSVGLPTITTNTGVIGNLIHSNNGFIVPFNDETEILNKLEYLRENINEYDRAKISSEIKNKFSEDKFLTQIEKIYRNVSKKF